MRGDCDCIDMTPGGGGCPSFVPADLVRAIKANRDVVDIIAGFAQSAGISLTGSVVLAPIGAPMAALGGILVIIAHDCDVGVEVLKHEARLACVAAQVGAIAASVGAAASLIGLFPSTGATVAPLAVFTGIAAVLGALVPILDALGKGRTPKLADVVTFAQIAASLGGVDLSSVKKAARKLDTVIADVANNTAVRSAIASIPREDAGGASSSSRSDPPRKTGRVDAPRKVARAGDATPWGFIVGGLVGAAGVVGTVYVVTRRTA